MNVPNDRKYLVSHEWHLPRGELIEIGITQFAADELTDVTYVKLPKVGTRVTKDTAWGEIESVKATSDLYSGVSGEVVEVNTALNNDPGKVNSDPYGAGWMIRVRPTATSDKLLDADAYLKAIGK
ncbi:MAG: glycine cleavage system protein GcvH [Tepidisphaerales bacterium]